MKRGVKQNEYLTDAWILERDRKMKTLKLILFGLLTVELVIMAGMVIAGMMLS